MATKFGIVITYTYKGTAYTMVLDNVSDNTVSSRSTLTTYPTVNGDMIGDHMYKEPATISFSGSISLDGNNGYSNRANNTKYSSYGTQLSLKGIEDWFKSIQDEAILCDIVKTSLDGNVFLGFRKLSQCVLTSCTWTEKINSLNYSMEFTQVMVTEVKETQSQIEDNYLPPLTEAQVSSFTEEYVDWSEVMQLIVLKLREDYMITDEFAENYVSKEENYNKIGEAIFAAGAGAVGAGAAYIGLVGIEAALTTNPAGWVVIAAGLLIIGIGALFKQASQNEARKQYAFEQFKYFKDDQKDAKEVDRFNNYIGNIMKYISKIDEAIKVYKITENIAQELIINIDNKYYSFKFKLSNVSGFWDLDITRPDKDDFSIKSNYSTLKGGNSLLDSSDNNCLFRVEGSGQYVYLVYAPLSNYSEEISTMSEQAYSQLLRDRRRDLRNYHVIVSNIPAPTIRQELEATIYDAMKL